MLSPQAMLRASDRRVRLSEVYQDVFFKRCRLKILVVADNFLYFNDEDFGLSEFVASLRARSNLLTHITVDLAHRGNPGAGRLAGGTPNFKFSDASLKGYQQIWIFAADYVSRDGPKAAISNDERRAIRKFMDDGGGVFATGDHDDLGATVGGYIPRVRSMRRWFMSTPVGPNGAANPGPQGEPNAPRGDTADRHDTNRPGHDGAFSFDDQSDDIPQPIVPHYFGGGFIRSVHPVLCGPNGPIRVLPDHPHEGLCEVPNVNATYKIGNDTFDEYPVGAGGVRPRPKVIATASVLAGAVASGKPPANPRTFGVIGAYDGTSAGVGRIVVDATWHHFININLVGDANYPANNPKGLGFLASPQGEAHLKEIESYYYNIARWLTPNAFRNCLIRWELVRIVNHGTFREDYRVDDLQFTGQLVQRLTLAFGKCDRFAWIRDIKAIDLIREKLKLPEEPRPWWHEIDPFIAEREPEVAVDADPETADLVGNTLLGGVAIAVLRHELARSQDGKEANDRDIAALDAAIDSGLTLGAQALAKRLDGKQTRDGDVLKRLFAAGLDGKGKRPKAG